jgi:hypothetical protein
MFHYLGLSFFMMQHIPFRKELLAKGKYNNPRMCGRRQTPGTQDLSLDIITSTNNQPCKKYIHHKGCVKSNTIAQEDKFATVVMERLQFDEGNRLITGF